MFPFYFLLNAYYLHHFLDEMARLAHQFLVRPAHLLANDVIQILFRNIAAHSFKKEY